MMKDDIVARNRWIIKRLKQDFPLPDYKIIYELFDWNNTLAVRVDNNLSGKKHTTIIEKLVDINPEKMDSVQIDENGNVDFGDHVPIWTQVGINFVSDKESAYKELAKHFKEMLNG